MVTGERGDSDALTRHGIEEYWVEAGLLQIWAVRSTEFGLDNHLAMVSGLVAERDPAVAVVDGIGSLISGPTRSEVTLMLARKFHMFKAQGITAMATVLTEGDAEATIGGSSRADTWLLLRNVESNGKRNRLLSVLKSRGTAHSDQVREFVLTDHWAELVDVHVAPGGGDDRCPGRLGHGRSALGRSRRGH